MRQSHRAGETLFVDYAGQTVPVVDRCTCEIHEAQVFVAVLGASNYTFAEAPWTQALPVWIGSHQRAFTFVGGVSETIVPGNLKSGMTLSHRYEPDLNPTYAEMAAHYNVAVGLDDLTPSKFYARLRNPAGFATAEGDTEVHGRDES